MLCCACTGLLRNHTLISAGVGEPFDPNVHDAIMREPNEEVPDGTVLEEFRKGFRLGETLLRPAMVKVSGGGGLRGLSWQVGGAASCVWLALQLVIV